MGFSQAPDPSASALPKSFHDPLLNVTYFYPGRFSAAPEQPRPSSSASAPQCAQSTLSASSGGSVNPAVFVLSTIDGTCPSVLRGAANDLAAFSREQLLRQLKRFGETPTITQEPSRYAIDGHPAVVTLGSVQDTPETGSVNITQVKTTYAAKACWLGNIPTKPRHRNELVQGAKHVLCFDFTTQQRDLLSLLYTFSIQFDNSAPQPLITGSAIR